MVFIDYCILYNRYYYSNKKMAIQGSLINVMCAKTPLKEKTTKLCVVTRYIMTHELCVFFSPSYPNATSKNLKEMDLLYDTELKPRLTRTIPCVDRDNDKTREECIESWAISGNCTRQ